MFDCCTWRVQGVKVAVAGTPAPLYVPLWFGPLRIQKCFFSLVSCNDRLVSFKNGMYKNMPLWYKTGKATLESRTTPPPDLQICLWPRVTVVWPWPLTSWPPKLVLCPFPCGPLMPIGVEVGSFVFRILHVFASFVTDDGTGTLRTLCLCLPIWRSGAYKFLKNRGHRLSPLHAGLRLWKFVIQQWKTERVLLVEEMSVKKFCTIWRLQLPGNRLA